MDVVEVENRFKKKKKLFDGKLKTGQYDLSGSLQTSEKRIGGEFSWFCYNSPICNIMKWKRDDLTSGKKGLGSVDGSSRLGVAELSVSLSRMKDHWKSPERNRGLSESLLGPSLDVEDSWLGVGGFESRRWWEKRRKCNCIYFWYTWNWFTIS